MISSSCIPAPAPKSTGTNLHGAIDGAVLAVPLLAKFDQVSAIGARSRTRPVLLHRGRRTCSCSFFALFHCA